MKDFQFNLGDTVGVQSTIKLWLELDLKRSESDRQRNAILGYPAQPITLAILERKFQECPGGIQVSYLCRYLTPNGYRVDWFNEAELVIWNL